MAVDGNPERCVVRIAADIIGRGTHWGHEDHLVFPSDKVHTGFNCLEDLALPCAAFTSNVEEILLALR